MRHWSRVIVFSVVIALMTFTLQGCTEADEPSAEGRSPAILMEYPSNWRTSLSEAQAKARFELLIPSHEVANSDNVTETFMSEDGDIVAMRFPPPGEPSAPVRISYIEIYEAPWERDKAPEEVWNESLEQHPGVAELRELDQVLMLVGFPHNDDNGDNPSHIVFVLDGVEVEIFGGDDSELLVDVARTMIRKASEGDKS